MELIIIEERYKGKDNTFNFGLCSDLHIGSDKLDKKRLISDLELFKKNNAKIFINGDILDHILQSDKRRYSASSDKYQQTAQINLALNEAEKLLKPYADNIVGIGVGNHETEVIKRHSIDTTSMLIRDINKLKSKDAEPCYHMGYEGFVRIAAKHTSGGACHCYDIFYNHGQGGSAEVTKGMIDLNRYQSRRADLIWLGHKHQSLSVFLDKDIYITPNNYIKSREKRGVITGAYMKDIYKYDIEKNGYRPNYSEEKMRTTQQTGGVMLQLKLSTRGINHRIIQ
jgi:hypothetical protein